MNMLRLSPTISVDLRIEPPAARPTAADLLSAAEFAEAILVEATPGRAWQGLWRHEPRSRRPPPARSPSGSGPAAYL